MSLKHSRLTTRIATTDEERIELFRLRYRVYVDEMRKPYPNSQGQLTDALDSSAVLFYVAAQDGRIVGTVRCNYAVDAQQIPLLASGLRLPVVSPHSMPFVTVCSRLVLEASYRRLGGVLQLLLAVYRWGLDHRIRMNLIHTAAHLVPLFEHLGFRRFGAPFFDPHAGNDQHPLCLVLRDASHLRAVRSPFIATGLAKRRLRSRNGSEHGFLSR